MSWVSLEIRKTLRVSRRYIYNTSLMLSCPKAILLMFFAGLCVCGGCGMQSQPYVTPDRLQRGLVIVLPGIEGRSALNRSICQGLDEGGVNWAIELNDWTSEWGPLVNLRSEERNRRKAVEISDRINRYRVAFPERPVILVGQSGGAAIAVWVAEASHPAEPLEGLVLVNAALSPEYSLIPALRNTRRGIATFYSPRDWFMLGLGTRIFQTMDGQHSVSAGKEGFVAPQPAPEEYHRLYQIGWNSQMADTGHTGLHVTSAASDFVSQFIAPLVLQKPWSADFMERVAQRELQRQIDSPQTASVPVTPKPETRHAQDTSDEPEEVEEVEETTPAEPEPPWTVITPRPDRPDMPPTGG